MFGKTAIGLLREVDGVPAENLPPYNVGPPATQFAVPEHMMWTRAQTSG